MKFFGGAFVTNTDTCKEEKQTPLTDEEYKKRITEFFEIALNINNSTSGWKLEKRAANGDIVESKYVPGLGKYYRITGEINFPPKRLISELFLNAESSPKWNPVVIEAKRVKLIGDTIDILYNVSAPAVGGLVSSRDFLSGRLYASREGHYMTGGGHVDFPDIPVHHQYIRSESGPGCQVARPIPGIQDRCIFQWTMRSQFNGWIPQHIMDMAIIEGMFKYYKCLRVYGDKLREEGLMDSELN